MKASTLKPGLLVSLKTSIRGGVDYQRNEIESDHTTAEGERVARWETTRTIPDPTEYERATQARGKARSLISAACCNSAFGLLCPTARESDLQEAIKAARTVAEDYNSTAAGSRVDVYVLIGRVASDDIEAARAINAEMRDVMEAMQEGIKLADPEIIRDAAAKAKQIGGMLTDETAGKVSAAINEARKAARDIVRRVEKAGEQASKVVAECATKSIEAARFAFLDLDAPAVVADAIAPAARGIDLQPDLSDSAPVALAAAQPEMEV